MNAIADTGLLVGFLDSSDQFHEWAAKCFQKLRVALTTCEGVMAETEYLVPGSGPALMEMVKRGTLRILPLLPAEADALGQLMKRYPKMQFADACVVRLSEALPDALVYTTDKRDFAIYRRRRNEMIKTVSPSVWEHRKGSAHGLIRARSPKPETPGRELDCFLWFTLSWTLRGWFLIPR